MLFAILRSALSAVLLGASLTAAAQAPAPAPSKIKVYLLGTFHFDGSPADVVKGTKTDMKNQEKQRELDNLISRLARTQADKVFVEWRRKDQPFVDSTYALYRAGRFQLGNNEVYQLGYRLAAQLKRPHVYCADADGVFDYEATAAYAKAHGQEATLASAFAGGPPDSLGRLIQQRVGHPINPDFTGKPGETLLQRFVRFNAEPYTRANMDAYLLTLARVGGADNYTGADLAGEFYKRNMRIYTNLLRAVDVQRDKAIILIIGAGHVGFLREQLQYSSLFEVQEVGPLLTAK
jgi:hypothetical protein